MQKTGHSTPTPHPVAHRCCSPTSPRVITCGTSSCVGHSPEAMHPNTPHSSRIPNSSSSMAPPRARGGTCCRGVVRAPTSCPLLSSRLQNLSLLPPPSPRARFSLLRRRALPPRGRGQLGLQRPANQLRHGAGAELWSQGGGVSSPRERSGALVFLHVEVSVIFPLRDLGDERSSLSGGFPPEDVSCACPWSHAFPRPSGLGSLRPRTLSPPAGGGCSLRATFRGWELRRRAARKRGRVSAPARREARGGDPSPCCGQSRTWRSP